MINKGLYVCGSILNKVPGLLKLFLNYKSDSLRIVYYHQVSNKKHEYYFNNKSITLREFEDQIIFLKKRYDIIDLKSAILLAENKQSLKKKLVITFDDGFTTNYSNVAPILRKHNINATFFLIGNSIDNKDLMWRNKLLLIDKYKKNNILSQVAEEFSLSKKGINKGLLSWSFNSFPMPLKEQIVNYLWVETMEMSVAEYLADKQPYLTTQQIKALNTEGFQFGSHSMSHPIFSKLTYEEFENEIVNSNQCIENIIGEEVYSFSYPFGKRALSSFEKIVQKETPRIKTFLGTRNNLNNKNENMNSWERDNLEFSFNIALSRFGLLSIIRSISSQNKN